jgi:hypothetical protein
VHYRASEAGSTLRVAVLSGIYTAMIQLAFAIEISEHATSPSLPVPPPPLRLGAHPFGRRVTGVWEDTSWTHAREEVAMWLDRLQPEHRVIDLLLGRGETAAEAAARLRQPVSVGACFHARHAPLDDLIWVRLFGLYQLGRPDLVLGVESDVDLHAAYAFLNRFAAFQIAAVENPERPALEQDKPIPFGHWRVGFGGADLADDAFWELLRGALQTQHLSTAFDDRMSAPAPWFVIEADDVTEADDDRWLLGGSRAIRTFDAQARACGRMGLGAPVEVPHAADAAVFCTRIASGQEGPGFFAYRGLAQGPIDSGWHFACLDDTHVHDETTTRIAPLSLLTRENPALTQYFGLPQGWVVTFEEGQYWVTAPGETRALLDEGHRPGAPWSPRL